MNGRHELIRVKNSINGIMRRAEANMNFPHRTGTFRATQEITSVEHERRTQNIFKKQCDNFQ